MKPSPEAYSAFREHLEQFIPVTTAEFARVLQYFTVRKLKKNRVLIRAGEMVAHTNWVKTGMLISNYTDANGKEHIMQFPFENCWVTDQNAFYNKEEAQFTITAVEDSEMLTLSFDDRERLCEDIRKMETFFRKKANDSFAKQQKRLLTYLTTDAKSRYDLVLTEYPPQVKRLSKKVLAAYVGVSRETLSRRKKK
jgi:CRP-like cAMP-binding protein